MISKQNSELMQYISDAIYRETDIDKSICDQIAFHIIDWKKELIALYELEIEPENYNSEQVVQVIQRFLIHATEHSLAASELLLGYTPENIFKE
jgi:hypothetical protein